MTINSSVDLSTSWQETASRKRQCVMEKIPSSWKLPQRAIDEAHKRRNVADEFIDSLLDDETRRITNLDVPDLMAAVAQGTLSALSLVTAFCKRAAYGHQLNHNLLEIGFERALKQAKALDKYMKACKRTVGPLHGLPVTVKDQYHVKGMETTMAYVGWINTFEGSKDCPRKGKAESELVRELESLGAVIIAKTTLVQTLWYTETNNNILGYNVNPRNQLLSSGGSSGGEGSVQALRGSAIGVGSDIGGSVSMPAAFNGVFSIKPSVGRLSFKNVPNSSRGQNNIATVPGILGTSADSLEYLMKSLISAQPWLYDPEVLPMPWREQKKITSGSRLSFGFMNFDGIVRPHPPILRALETVKQALLKNGHEILPWNPPSHSEGIRIHEEITGADGCYDVFEQLKLSGEPLIPELWSEFPDCKPLPPYSAIRVEKSVAWMTDYRARYQQYWMSTADMTTTRRPVDALILPVVPSAAVIPGKLYYYSYITVANVLDHTTMVLPVTRADKDLDTFDHSYSPVGDLDKKTWETYDPEIYHGAPASIQLQAGRLQEEKLLAIGRVVAEALQGLNASGPVSSHEVHDTPREKRTAPRRLGSTLSSIFKRWIYFWILDRTEVVKKG